MVLMLYALSGGAGMGKRPLGGWYKNGRGDINCLTSICRVLILSDFSKESCAPASQADRRGTGLNQLKVI